MASLVVLYTLAPSSGSADWSELFTWATCLMGYVVFQKRSWNCCLSFGILSLRRMNTDTKIRLYRFAKDMFDREKL